MFAVAPDPELCCQHNVFFTINIISVCKEIVYPIPHCHTFYFATQMKLLSSCSNIGWKFAQKWIIIWFSKERKDPSGHNMFQKYQKFWTRLTFDFSKFKFQNGLKPTTYFLGVFWDKLLRSIQTPKKMWKYNCRF